MLQASQPAYALMAFDYFWKRQTSCIFINFECLFTRSFRVLLRSFVSIQLPPYNHVRNAEYDAIDAIISCSAYIIANLVPWAFP